MDYLIFGGNHFVSRFEDILSRDNDWLYGLLFRSFALPFTLPLAFLFTVLTAGQKDTRWGQPVLPESTFPVNDCWALRRGRINKMVATAFPLYCAHIGSAPPDYAMCVPLAAQGETLGILYLDSGKGEAKQSQVHFEQLSESEERMVKTLAEHLALAVANLKLRETLRTQSIRDPLTGIFNRRYMEESLERELRRTIRKKLPLALLMVDVDHFKHFNDTFGHEAGDEILRELARLFQSRLRAEDIACRYGGEEFVLILPEAMSPCRPEPECNQADSSIPKMFVRLFDDTKSIHPFRCRT